MKYLSVWCVVDEATREQQCESNLARGLPVCQIQMPPKKTGRLAIVGCGPSILDYWNEIVEHKFIWAINGAYGYLLNRGLVPDFVTADPHEAVLEHVTVTNKASKFYLTSVAHPSVLDHLEGHKVRLWHSDGNAPEGYEPRVVGGSTTVTRAICLARMLGWRDITVYGAESSFEDKRNITDDENSDFFEIAVPHGSGRIYKTTMALMHQASDISTLAEIMQEMDPAHPVKWRCGGLTEELLNSPIMHMPDELRVQAVEAARYYAEKAEKEKAA